MMLHMRMVHGSAKHPSTVRAALRKILADLGLTILTRDAASPTPLWQTGRRSGPVGGESAVSHACTRLACTQCGVGWDGVDHTLRWRVACWRVVVV
jgi:hypothetical protein